MATILIVEDHAISRQMLSNLLGYKGHHVLEAADGVEALALARAEHPDLIITDVVMPAMDGLELVRRLRADAALKNIPAIFYTAASLRTGAREIEEQCGNSRVLPKPSDPQVILQTVDEALAIAQPPSSPTPAAVAFRRPANKTDPLRGTELQLAVLIDLGFHLVRQREPTKLLNTFCGALREILNCRRCLLVVSENGDEERCFSGDPEDASAAAWPARLLPPPQILERLKTKRAPVRWLVPPAGADAEPSSVAPAPAKSVLAAPFATPSRVHGHFLLADKKDGTPFDDQDEEMAVTLGAQTALAYENILLVDRLLKQSTDLRLSEERLRLMIEGAKDYAIVMLDPLGNLTTWNAGAAHMTGWSAAEILGRHLDRLYPQDEDGGRHARRVLELAELTGQHQEIGERRRKDGSLFWADVTISAVRDAAGQLRGFAKVTRDITGRKRAEEEQERSRQGLSRLAEASLKVVREADVEGMLQAVSEAALLLTDARLAACGHGYVTGQFIVGGSARAEGAPACPEGRGFRLEKGGVYMDLLEGADTIRLTDVELRAHPRWWGLPDGHVPMRGLLGAKLTGRDARSSGLLLVTDKATGEFTAEDESLLRQLATLASLALQHVEVRIALERSDQRKSQFLGMLSHELRNPLAPIRNSLYILERAAPGGEQALRAKTVIDRQVSQLTRLVDDLLDVTRISRGKIQIQRELLDVGDVARRAVEDYRSVFAKSGVELTLHLPECPLWVSGDRTRIAQIIGNLLSNSAKFTEAGGQTVVVVEENTNLRQVILRVRDTGIGIAPEMLPRMFEEFAQADTTLDRSKGGLGLGLALVRGLVELHGGAVTAKSGGLGKGAEVTVRFPLEAAQALAAEPVRGVVSNAGARRVLVIEDNVDAAESLREALELGDHMVEVAYSGTEGLEKARAFRPDVILCDIGLPGMDGYAVARAMRSDPKLSGVSLVALTGYALPEDLARAKAAGFDEHLAKPPSVEKLEELLSRMRR
ncbi:MAG: response regulator [Deltaproteobacteria bacterium]|nr:response regulator [Deltaproteobacteria bacterium]